MEQELGQEFEKTFDWTTQSSEEWKSSFVHNRELRVQELGFRRESEKERIGLETSRQKHIADLLQKSMVSLAQQRLTPLFSRVRCDAVGGISPGK